MPNTIQKPCRNCGVTEAEIYECTFCPRSGVKSEMCVMDMLRGYEDTELLAICTTCAKSGSLYGDECLNNDKTHVREFHNA